MSAKSAGSVGVEIVALNAQKAIGEMKAYVSSLTQMESATKKATDTINNSFSTLGKSGGINTLTTGIKQIDTQVKSTTSTVTQGANQMDTAFKKVGTDISQSAQKASTGLKQIDTTTKQVSQGANQISAAYKKVGTDIDTSVRKGDQSLKTLTNTTKTVATGTTQISQAYQKVGTDITTSVNKGTTGLKTLETTTKTLATGTTQVSAAYQKVGTDIQTSSQKASQAVQQLDMKFRETNTVVSTFGNTTRTVATNVDQYGQAIGKTVTEVTKLKDSTTEVTTVFNAQGQAIDKNIETYKRQNEEVAKTVSTTSELKTTMVGMIGSVSALGASLFQLYHSYDRLRLAQVATEAAANKVSKANESVEKNQNKVNNLYKTGQQGTTAYANAVRDLEQSKVAYGISLEKQITIQEREKETVASFYLNIIPEAISTIGSLTSVATDVIQVQRSLSKSSEEVGSAAEGAAEATTEVGQSLGDYATEAATAITVGDKVRDGMKNMGKEGVKSTSLLSKMGTGITNAFSKIASVLGGVGGAFRIALTAIGSFIGVTGGAAAAVGASVVAIVAAIGALALYATNAFGARDAMNAWGKSLGEMVPQFKIVGDALVGVLGTIGLTGETVAQTTAHFNAAATGWNDAVASMQASDNVLVQDIGFTVAAVGTQFSKMGVEMGTQLQNSINAWDEFVGALASGDFEGAVDIIIKSLEAIPEIVGKLGEGLGTAFENFKHGISIFGKDILKQLTDTGTGITDWATGVGTTITKGIETAVGLIDAIIGRIVPGWGDIKQQVGTWLTTNIVEPLTGWYEMIAVPAGQLWDYIVGTATSIAATVSSWVTDNIVTPILSFVGQITLTPEGIWNAILGASKSIVATVNKWVTDNIVNPIIALPGLIVIGAETLWNAILGTVTNIKSTVDNWITDNIVDPIKEFPSTIVGEGAEMAKALLEGDLTKPINDYLSGLWSGFQDWVSGITGGGGEKKAAAPPTGKPQELESLPVGPQLSNAERSRNKKQNEESINNLVLAGEAKDKADAKKQLEQQGRYLQEENATRQVPKAPKSPLTTIGVAYPQTVKGAAATGTTISAGVATGAAATGTAGINPVFAQGNMGLGSSIGLSHTVKAGRAFPTTATAAGTGTMTDKEWQQQFAVGRSGGTAAAQTEKKLPDVSKLTNLMTQKNKLSAAFGKDQGEFITGESIEVLTKKLGILSALRKSIDETGVSQQAYGSLLEQSNYQDLLATKGSQDRVKAMQDMQTANATAIGYNKEYADQIANQNLLGVAYESGLRKQETALMDQQVALAAAQGETAKLNEQMATGLPQAIAYAEGVNKQEMALNNMQLATAGTQGELMKLSSQLEDGTIQAAAFESGYTNAAMSAKQMQVDVASLAGEVTYLGESLTKSEDIIARQNMAYLEAQKGMIEWGMEMQTFDAANKGSLVGIKAVADMMGVKIPDSFKGGTEALQEFISLTAHSGEIFESFISGLEEGFKGTASKLGEAILSSNKDLKTAIDEYSEELGIDFDEGTRKALTLEAGLSGISESVGQISELLAGVELPQESFNNIQAQMREKYTEIFEDIPKELQPKAQAAFDQLIGVLSTPVDSDNPDSVKNFLGDLGAAMVNFESISNPVARTFAESMKTINESSLDNIVGQYGGLTKTLEASKDPLDQNAAAWQRYYTALNSGDTTGAAAALKEIEAGATGTGTAAGTATPQVKAFYDQLASFGGLQTVLQVIFEQNFPTFVQNGLTTATGYFNEFNGTLAETLGTTSTVMQTIFETSLPAFAETGTAAVIEKFEAMKTSIESILSSIDLSQIGAGAEGGGEKNQAGAGAGAGAEGEADISGGGGGEGGPEGEATGFLAKLTEQMAQVPVIITAAFTTGINNAMGLYNMLNDYTVVLVENINVNLQLVIEYFTTTFTTAVNNAMGVYNLLNDYTAVLAENINSSLQPVIEHFTTTFNQAVQNAAGMYNALNDYTKVLVANIGTEIAKVTAMFTATFTSAVNSAKTQLSSLGTHAHSVFADIVASINGAKNALTALITQTNSASSAMDGLKSSADTATQSVEDLGAALDNLEDKEVTVTTHYVTTGTPVQQGTILPRFAAGGNMISDFRPNKVLVGENGKELVMLSGGGPGGTSRSFIADHMQDVDIRDKDLTVIPLERRNSENFLKKFPMFKPLVDMLKEGKNIPRFAFGVSPSADPNTASGPITTSSDGKVHTWEDGDTALTIDEWNAQSDGTRRGLAESDDVGIKSLPDKSYLENDYSISANDPHGTGNTNGYINNTKWRTGPNAGKRSDAYDAQGNPTGAYGGGGNGGGNSNQGGTPPAAGSPGYIKPGGWGAGGWYEDWKVVPMRDEPGKWKVIDISDGKNVAVGFTSEEQANAWIDWYVAHPNVKPPGTINNASTGYHGPAQSEGYPTGFGGGTGTGNGGVPSGTPTGSPVDNDWEGIQTTGGEKWTTSPQGELSATKMTDSAHKGQYKVVDSQGKNVAANFKSEQDANQWIDEYNATNPANGGGGGGGNGNGNGGGGGTGGGGTGGTPAQTYTVPSQVFLAGNPNDHSNPDVTWAEPSEIGDPETWKVARMVEVYQPTGERRWKVVNKDGKNIASRFDTEADAQAYIDAHIDAKDSGTYTSPTTGGGTLTTKPAVPGTGNGGVPSGTPTGTPYTQPDYVQTSGGTKWSTSPGEPSSWQVVPMTDAAHQGEFKVVDAEGKNVAANFKSQQEATDYVNYKKGTPTGGGGGTGGTGGTPAIPASTYTAPAGVRNLAQAQASAESTGVPLTPNWQNADMNPDHWKVVEMVQDPGSTNFAGWKVVDGQDRNIAVRFPTKAEAEEYVREHQLAKARGGTAAPVGGGETLNIPGVAAVPGTGGGGGTGGGVGGTTGGTIPGYNGNFNYQINNKGLQITGGTITKNELAAEDWPAADAAFFKATGKHLPPYSSSAAGGGGGTPVVGDSEGSLPGWGGETYVPGTGGTAKGTGATSGGGGGTYTGAGSGAQNFAPGSVAGGVNTGGISTGIPNVPGTGTGTGTGGIGGINFPPGFPFHDRPEVIAGGGPNIGGIQFPVGFPFNNNAAPTGTAATTGVTQTQSINQASNINGQGNNTNFDTMSGTNSRLQIQNGKIVAATGIFANWKLGDALPGLGGTGGTGGTGGIAGNPTLQALLHQAPTVPRITSNNYDSMGIPEANEADPLFREFGFNKIMNTSTGGVGGNNPSTPGGAGKWFDVIGRLLGQLNDFTQALLGKTLNSKSIWQNMSHLTSNNIGTLP